MADDTKTAGLRTTLLRTGNLKEGRDLFSGEGHMLNVAPLGSWDHGFYWLCYCRQHQPVQHTSKWKWLYLNKIYIQNSCLAWSDPRSYRMSRSSRKVAQFWGRDNGGFQSIGGLELCCLVFFNNASSSGLVRVRVKMNFSVRLPWQS